MVNKAHTVHRIKGTIRITKKILFYISDSEKIINYLLGYLVISDVVTDRLIPQVTLTAVFRCSPQHQLPSFLLIHF